VFAVSLNAMATRALEDRRPRGDSSIVAELFDSDALGPKESPRQRRAATRVTEIVTYIPTEIVTVYVAAAAAISTRGATPGKGQWVLMWIVFVLTPVATWMVFAAKVRALGDPLPSALRDWPWPQMLIASTAFLLWSFTLPGAPFAQFGWYRPGLSAVVLLVGTTVLGLIAPLLPSAGSAAEEVSGE
jgi:hypothetical protein